MAGAAGVAAALADLLCDLGQVDVVRIPRQRGPPGDESAEDVRLVLVPKSRNVDPELLKESLYKLTDLEVRFPLNLNVLDAQRRPGVMSLKEALLAWAA